MDGVSTQTMLARNGAIDIAYEDLGGAGGDPLLLIMGMGVSRFWWPDGFIRALIARGFHVVAYDQRDAGESTHLDESRGGSPISTVLRRSSAVYSAEDMTDDAVAVLDAAGWDSAHVFGASMGGTVAQRLALRHPDRVRTVTSMASLPSDVRGLAALRYVRAGQVARLARLRYPDTPEGDIALGLALARAVASPGYPFDEAGTRERIQRDVRSGVRDVSAQARQAGAKWHGGKLSALRKPVLVVHGDKDQLLRPAAGRDTAAAIDGARLVLLPGVGHDLPAAIWPQLAAEMRLLADTTRCPAWIPPASQPSSGSPSR